MRARRGEVGLVRNRSGYWAIRWGRALHREAGVPALESTGTKQEAEAEKYLHRRMFELKRFSADAAGVEAARRRIQIPAIRQLVSEFLLAYQAGDLDGRMPMPRTVKRAVVSLLGESGLVPYAESTGREFGSVLIRRWLEHFERRESDTRRNMLVAARHVARYAEEQGYLSRAEAEAVLRISFPKKSKGRARREGVATKDEVKSLIEALSPSYWRVLAEAQARLGLRRGELLAMEPSWLNPDAGTVTVTVSERFKTKSGESRTIDGVDAVTMRIATEACRLVRQRSLSAGGYSQALERARRRLASGETPWKYSRTSHALRVFYATEGKRKNVPLHVLRDRLGHADESTTDRYYIGRQDGDGASPFEGEPSLTLGHLRVVSSG